MKIALVLYDNFSNLDFSSIYASLLSAKRIGSTQDITFETCAYSQNIKSDQGIRFAPEKVDKSLENYDLVIIPGNTTIKKSLNNQALLDWLYQANQADTIAAVGNGVLFAAAAGLLREKKVASLKGIFPSLEDFGAVPIDTDIVKDGNTYTAAGSAFALEFALQLCEDLVNPEIGKQIREQMGQTIQNDLSKEREAKVRRETKETSIDLFLKIDGTGKHEISTGLPFLDHMLTQIAVHGLFDLNISAKGDIEIDPHHTMEDIGLALGQAYREALGNRKGIFRMASQYCTMDECLALVALDFSGRPYAVIQTNWNDPSVGGLPTSLFAHFLESFALEARCNLHVQVFYGRDDHHQAEAIFKALARALDAATRIDPRRAEQIPSSKGILF